jgi:hypothetical protein
MGKILIELGVWATTRRLEMEGDGLDANIQYPKSFSMELIQKCCHCNTPKT